MQIRQSIRSLKSVAALSGQMSGNGGDIVAIQKSDNTKLAQPERPLAIARQKLRGPAAMRTLIIATCMLLCSGFLSSNWLQPAQALAATTPKQSTYEKGIIYPRYNTWSYSAVDQDWQLAVKGFKTQI